MEQLKEEEEGEVLVYSAANKMIQFVNLILLDEPENKLLKVELCGQAAKNSADHSQQEWRVARKALCLLQSLSMERRLKNH